MSALNQERVLSVRHWNDTLFSFTTTRDASFRFRSGQFTMVGMEIDGKRVMRAYSLASAYYDDTLEFFSIKVPDGPLTSKLQYIKEGNVLYIGKKPTGTLLIDNLRPGRTAYLVGTGTGLAPFLSLIRDPDIYERFEKVVLIHGCRNTSDLAYYEMITRELPEHELLGDLVRNQLIYYPTVTREPFRNRGRVTDLIASGKLFSDLGLPSMDREHDRFILCGSPAMLADSKELLENAGFEEGSSSAPGDYVIEKAFVEK
ncbi:MAG: ferredoxin--NADP reductase [Pseudomonadota bacterium]